MTMFRTSLIAATIALSGTAALAQDHGHGGDGPHGGPSANAGGPARAGSIGAAHAAPQAAIHTDARHENNEHHDSNYQHSDYHDRNNYRRPSNVVNVGPSGYARPRYIPERYYGPYGYHDRGPRYYSSYYYTSRYVPIEPANPYVEVRCGSQPIIGTVVGGVAGGLVGNQFGRGRGRVGTTVGGALLGAIIGQSIDRASESCAYQALEYAQPNTQVGWADPDNSNAYAVIPGPVTQEGNGRYCREYQAKVLVGNRMEDGYGTACRQPDGSWEVQN